MALPKVFANVSVLSTPDLDSDFNALGALTTIPCTATGTNTIALTPNASTPTIAAYTTMSPVFAFIAAGSNSGATTINVSGIGAKTLYKTNGATAVGSGDIISGSLYLVNYNPALNSSAGGWVLVNPSTTQAAPTVQTFTSGSSATYTPSAGMVRIRVRMSGGGAGGGAAVTNNGTAGNDSSFENWTAKGGGVGLAGAAGTGKLGGAGGTGGADGTGTKIVRLNGGAGDSTTGIANFSSGHGGGNPFGGGAAAQGTGATGLNAATNTGGGGSGGANGASGIGSSGGAGEYVEFWMTAAQVGASKTYTVGAAANGGAAGTFAGGNGAAGIIIIEEFYI